MKFSVVSTIALIGAAQAAPSAVVDLPADMSPRAAINEAESMSFTLPSHDKHLSNT